MLLWNNPTCIVTFLFHVLQHKVQSKCAKNCINVRQYLKAETVSQIRATSTSKLRSKEPGWSIYSSCNRVTFLQITHQTFLVISGNALVYGNTLEAFSMVQTLLAVGVPGSRVVLVQPPVSIPTCFNNPFIEDAVTAALKECGRCRLKIHYLKY